MFLKGLTAQYLVRSAYPVRRGETVLIHAVAGGVGLLLCQWAQHLGATVIGTVSSPEKAAVAREHGCHDPIDSTKEDVVARVRELTDRKGLPVVYDSVGASTFEISMSSPPVSQMSAAALPAATEQLALVAALCQRSHASCASRLGMAAVLLEHKSEMLSDEF